MSYTLKQKRNLIARFLEIKVLNGYDITVYIFLPSTFFDYEQIEEIINEYNEKI